MQLPKRWEDLSVAAREPWLARVVELPLPPLTLGLGVSSASIEEMEPAVVSEKVSADPVLAGKVLAVANSAAMGLVEPVTSLERAVVHLGYHLVQIIVVGYHLEAVIGRWPYYPRDHFDYIRRWSSGCSVLAHHIAGAAGMSEQPTVATAALLARLGSLLLALEWAPGRDYQLMTDELARLRYEEQRWGISAPVLSGRLARHWALPEPLPSLLEGLSEPLCRSAVAEEAARRLVVVSVAVVLAAAALGQVTDDAYQVLELPAYQVLLGNVRVQGLVEPVHTSWRDATVQRELEVLTKEG